MARRVKRVTIAAEGRDRGKVFELTEMPSDQGERFATRLLLALANAGAKLPAGALDVGGMAGLEMSWRGLIATGIVALQGLDYETVAPLLDEMKHFIKWCPPGLPAPPAQSLFPGENCQIEEIGTWFSLRYELFELHLGFSLAGVLSTSGSAPPETPPA